MVLEESCTDTLDHQKNKRLGLTTNKARKVTGSKSDKTEGVPLQAHQEKAGVFRKDDSAGGPGQVAQLVGALS